jgi:F420-non-reducing hydrogenase iron-sulfur subunit
MSFFIQYPESSIQHLSVSGINKEETMMTDWEPKIAAFLCNWCSYGAADLAGVGRMEYPPNIRVIRIPCTGRMSPKFFLAALREGADGVWVSG